MSFTAGIYLKGNTNLPPDFLTRNAKDISPQENSILLGHKMNRYEIRSSHRALNHWSEQQRHGICISGNILNWDEIGLRTRDTEGLIKLFRDKGPDKFFNLLSGDYLIVIYDGSTDEIVLGRDRLGIFPCYFTHNEMCFGFSTRPRMLLRYPGTVIGPRKEFVGLYAGSHYRFFENNQEQSPFEGIDQVPSAHYLLFKNGVLKLKRYWGLEEADDWKGTEKDLAVQYRELIEQAVKRRLKAVKNPAFTLSGGMDSSSVLASVRKATNMKQHAFSTTHTDKVYDESDEIKSMLEENVQEWHPILIDDPNVPELIGDIIETQDSPIPTVTWLSHYVLAKSVAEQGFDGLFGGLGGDELNAGEFEHFFFFFADLKSRGHEDRLREEIIGWQKHHDHPIYKKNFELVEEYFKKVIDFKNPGKILPDKDRLFCYAHALVPENSSIENFRPIYDHPFKGYLKNRTYQDMTRETIPCCLRAEYFNSSKFSFHSFSPFLDHELIEFAFRVPVTMKYHYGVTKGLLREAMKGLLPEETRTRVKKTGWNAPAHLWFSGKGRDMLFDVINSAKFRARGIYNVDVVKRLLTEHDEIIKNPGIHKENHMMFFWQMLNLEIWLDNIEKEKHFKQREGPGLSGEI